MINHDNGDLPNEDQIDEKVDDFMNSEEAVNNVVNDQETVEENEFLLVFDKPVIFEGRSYKEVDLSGLQDLTAETLSNLERNFSKKGISSIQPEVSVSYAIMLAPTVCELPIEFFQVLPAKEAIKLKNMVVGFFYA